MRDASGMHRQRRPGVLQSPRPRRRQGDHVIHTNSKKRHGVTIIDVTVLLSTMTSITSVLLVAGPSVQDDAMVTRSGSNLRNLAVSNDTYAIDWANRQFTAVPDDIGIVGGNSTFYSQEVGCMEQLIAGEDAQGEIWGWWRGGGLCRDQYPGDQVTWEACFERLYLPMDFDRPSLGSFRLPTLMAFNAYVGDRWYDPVFWAPKDAVSLDLAKTMFDQDSGFGFTEKTLPGTWEDLPPLGGEGGIALSSYVWSPAAMYHPTVFDKCGFNDPSRIPIAYKSPATTQCKFPSLKTRMIEYHWLQNAPGTPSRFKHEGDPTWLFSQGLSSMPAMCFFDGHVDTITITQMVVSDTLIREMSEGAALIGKGPCEGYKVPLNEWQNGLWSRDTPLGAGGYFSAEAIGGVSTGAHVVTTDGIRGRDVVSLENP